MDHNNECTCGSGEEPRSVYDGYGIYLCKVCFACEDEKLSRYRKDIFEQYDSDENIENDY